MAGSSISPTPLTNQNTRFNLYHSIDSNKKSGPVTSQKDFHLKDIRSSLLYAAHW